MIKQKDDKALGAAIRKCMIYLGFNFANIGTVYLYDLMIILMNNPNLIHSITDGLLAEISKNHGCISVKNIERDIRSSIARAYSKDVLCKISCFSYGKPPKIKELVCYLFDYFTGFDYAY